MAVAASQNAASALADALGSPQRNDSEDGFSSDDDDDGEELAEDLLAAEKGHDIEAFMLLKQLQSREEQVKNADAPPPQLSASQALDGAGNNKVKGVVIVPDQALLHELRDATPDRGDHQAGQDHKDSGETHKNGRRFLSAKRPVLLSAVLGLFPMDALSSIDSLWPHLWQLLETLREGCDSYVLPKPKNFRECKKDLNWHQLMEHEAAKLRAISGTSAKRTSRIAAWMALAASLSKKISNGNVPPPETISAGDVLLVLPVGLRGRTSVWQVVCIMCFASITSSIARSFKHFQTFTLLSLLSLLCSYIYYYVVGPRCIIRRGKICIFWPLEGLCWGGVGWGGVLTFWRPRPWYYFDKTCRGNLEDVLDATLMTWGGVGWGGVLTFWRPRPWYYVDKTCRGNLEDVLDATLMTWGRVGWGRVKRII